MARPEAFGSALLVQRGRAEMMLDGTMRDRATRAYTWMVALLPNVAIYASGVPGINLGELALITVIGLIALTSVSVVRGSAARLAPGLHLVAAYAGIVTMSTLLFADSAAVTVVPRLLRFVFYLLVVDVASRRYFNASLGMKVVVGVAAANTAVIAIQSIIYNRFGVVWRGWLPFLSLYTEAYAKDDSSALYTQLFYRPTGLFLEPAHYSQYALLALVVVLFRWNERVFGLLLAVVFTAGIALSTSGQGILIVVLVWAIYFARLASHYRNPLNVVALVIVLPLLVVFVLPQLMGIAVVQNGLSRLGPELNSQAITGRSEGYLAVASQESVLRTLFGSGIGNTPEGVWFASDAYLLYCLGIVGAALYLGLIVRSAFRYREAYVRVLAVVALALAITCELLVDYWLVLVLSLMLYADGSAATPTHVSEAGSSRRSASWHKKAQRWKRNVRGSDLSSS